MSLLRRQVWDPFADLETITGRLNRLLDMGRLPIPYDNDRSLTVTDWQPSCEISETDKEYRVRVDLPDVKKEDVHVTFQNGMLNIQGERREDKEQKGVRYHRREMSYGKFVRSFTLPDDTDGTKIDASFKDGVLNILLPRFAPKEIKAKEIAVH